MSSPVVRLHVAETDTYLDARAEVLNGAELQPANSPIDLYLAPADTFGLIAQWARDRNLIEGATPQAQMLKMTEEVGELAHAVARKDSALAADAIGDCVVVLTILAGQLGMDIRDCIAGAYDEIKDRRGRMVDGIFIKEPDHAKDQ